MVSTPVHSGSRRRPNEGERPCDDGWALLVLYLGMPLKGKDDDEEEDHHHRVASIITNALVEQSPSHCGSVNPTPQQRQRVLKTPVSRASSGYPVNLKAWSDENGFSISMRVSA